MALAHQSTVTPIGEILARQILPRLRHAAKLPLRVIFIGTASYSGEDDADSFDRSVFLGDHPSLEDAVTFAALSVTRGDFGVGSDDMLRFRPRLAVIQDNDHAGRAQTLLPRHVAPPCRRPATRGAVPPGRRLHLIHPFNLARPSRRAFSFQEPDMANYFTHFSYLLDVGTPDNAARALELYNKLSEEGASEEPPSEGFLLSIQPEHGGTRLWMRDDETGDPERLIQFVKICAAEFGLTGLLGFQYANTCSRPRLDGFGGGAHGRARRHWLDELDAVHQTLGNRAIERFVAQHYCLRPALEKATIACKATSRAGSMSNM